MARADLSLTPATWKHGPVDLGHGIRINEDELAEFCAEHGVKRLAVFGSVLGDRFTDESDLDLLVEFEVGSNARSADDGRYGDAA